MEGMALIQFSHPLPGEELFVVGDIHMHQKIPLNKRFAPADENFESLISDRQKTFELAQILDNYARRNSKCLFKNSSLHTIISLLIQLAYR